MAKLIGFLLLLLVLPLGILATIVLLASIKFHSAAAPCIRQETRAVTVWQGRYADIQLPFATTCVARYNGH